MITYDELMKWFEEMFETLKQRARVPMEDAELFFESVPTIDPEAEIIVVLPRNIVRYKMLITYFSDIIEERDAEEDSLETNSLGHVCDACEVLLCAATSMLIGEDLFHQPHDKPLGVRKINDNEYALTFVEQNGTHIV